MWVELFLCILLAHLVADYVFQTSASCKNKTEKHWCSVHQYIHALIVFGLTWLVSWDVDFWLPALFVGLSHFAIDIWKSYRPDNIKWFVVEVGWKKMLYLQKRAMTKDLLPGYWDTAVGGHVTYGEQAVEALYREAAEELGLHAFNPIPLDTYTYQTERDSEFVFIYGMVGHPDIAPDESEVSEGKWWSQEELDAAFGKNILTPNFESEFPQIRARLLALL